MHHHRSTSCSARTPAHVGIIMDGNGRWAQSRGLPRFEGHRRGVEAVRRVVRSAIERGVRRLEFPPGPTPWKVRWGASEDRVHDEVSIYASSLPALIRGVCRRVSLQLHLSMGPVAPG